MTNSACGHSSQNITTCGNFVFFLSQLFCFNVRQKYPIVSITMFTLSLYVFRYQPFPNVKQSHHKTKNILMNTMKCIPIFDLWILGWTFNTKTRGCFLSEKNSLKICGFIASLFAVTTEKGSRIGGTHIRR